MSKRSIIYRHISIYRVIMNILYLGKYRKRFFAVIKHLQGLPKGTRVLELCFGDIYIAEYCKTAGYHWKGFDLNQQFVAYAQKSGYDAHADDLIELKKLPGAEVCIMMGSLYHFHANVFAMLQKMLEASKTVIISEPVMNLTSSKGLTGFLAKKFANAGKGNEEFRYNNASLLEMLEKNSTDLHYRIASVQDHGKDLVIKLIKNGSN